MSNISLRRSHTMSKQAARERSASIVDELKTKFGILYSWEGDTIKFKSDVGPGKGTNGFIVVSESDVSVSVSLPTSLSLMKSYIETKLTEALKSNFG